MSVLGAVGRFIGIGVLWGTSYMWISLALESFSWQFLTWLRPMLGLATLGAFLLAKKIRDPEMAILPKDIRIWLKFALVGLFFTALPSMFYAFALGGLSSSAVSVYHSTVPLITALLAGLIFRTEILTTYSWAGILVGGVGVTFVIEPWKNQAHGYLLNQLAVAAAVLCVAFAYVYQKKLMSAVRLGAIEVAFLITVGAVTVEVLLTPVMLVGPIDFNPISTLCLAVLGIGTGAVGYVWNAQIVTQWGATGGAMVSYLNPITGVLAGTLFLGEEFSVSAVVGTLFILGGIALYRMPSLRRSAAIK